MLEIGLGAATRMLAIAGLGVGEMLIILAIVIVLFGASRLPQLGRGLGEGIRNFKGGLKEDSSQGSIESAKEES